MTDFELCHKYLYHSSPVWMQGIPRGEYAGIVALGDGYGKLSFAELQEMELLYDWSHVRDSSEKAISEMAEKIRSFLRKL